jgi:hypothetical protein
MNIYFLVEGNSTEKQIYPKWLEYLIPNLKRVKYYDQVENNNYYTDKKVKRDRAKLTPCQAAIEQSSANQRARSQRPSENPAHDRAIPRLVFRSLFISQITGGSIDFWGYQLLNCDCHRLSFSLLLSISKKLGCSLSPQTPL